MPNNRIKFGIDFDIDKASLDSLRNQLKDLQKITQKDLKISVGGDAKKQLESIRSSAIEVENALNRAFNSNLGTLNITKFNTELKNLNLKRIASDFNSAGASGRQAFNSIASAALTTNTQLKQTFTFLDRMKTTLSNTLKWNIAAGAVNELSRSVQSAFDYVKQLDTSLTNIRIVTGESRAEMARFAVEANKASQAMGRQTKDYTKSYLAYVQQGLGKEESTARTEATLKAANVTGARASNVANDLTAVWNGFKVSTENTVNVVDKLAAVADSSASNLSELAAGMGRVASIANNMGVSIDQMNAMLATTIATTRQAPETVGNAYKTIFARINDIKTGAADAEISLGNYSERMASLGFSVLDATGHLRETGEVMEEIGNRWSSLTKEQQVYLASTMAGQRQMNNLVALFDNWGQYQQMVNTSLSSAGALEQKNDRYLESLSAHMNSFKAAAEGVQDTIINENDLKALYDAGTKILNLFNNFTQGIGGTHNALLALGSVMGRTFSNDLANGLVKIIQNFQAVQDNLHQTQAELDIIQQYKNFNLGNQTIDQLVEWKTRILDFGDAISQNEQKVLNSMMQEYVEIENQKIAWEDAKKKADEYFQRIQETDSPKSISDLGLTRKDLPKDKSDLGSDKYREATKALTDQEENIEATKREFIELNKAITDATVAQAAYEREVSEDNSEKAAESLADLRDTAELTADAMIELARMESTSVEQKKILAAAVREYNAAMRDENADPIAAAQNLLKAYQLAMAKIAQEVKETRHVIEQEVNGVGENLDNAGEVIKRNVEKMLEVKDLQNFVTNIFKATSALGGMASALFSLSNIPKIWSDENLSDAEKFLRIISAIGFALPMLTNNAGVLIDSIGKISTQLKTLQGASAFSTINLSQGFTVLGQSLLGVESAATTATASLGSIVAAAGLVVVAIGAIGVAVYAIYKYWNRFNEAAERAQKNAENLAKVAQEAKQKVNELKDSFNNYDSAVDKLEECIRGTQEWRDALQQVNEQALAILDKYPQLLAMEGLFKRDEDGTLKFDQSKVNEAIKKATDAADAASLAALQGKGEAAAAQDRASEENLKRKISGSLGGSYSQGTLSKYVDTETVSKAILNNVDKLSNLTKDEFKSKLTEILDPLGAGSDEVISKLVGYKDTIDQLALSTKNTSQSLDNIGKVIAAEKLGSNYDSTVVSMAGEAYNSTIKKIKEEIKNQGKFSSNLSGSELSNEKLFQRYRDALNDQSLQLTKINGAGDNKSFLYKQDGEQKKATLEQIASTVAAYEALNQLTDSAKQASETLSTIDKNVSAAGAQGIKNFISDKNINNLSKKDFDAMSAEVDAKGGAEAYLKAAFNVDDLSAIAQQLGQEDSEHLISAFSESFDDYEGALENIKAGMLNKVKTAFYELTSSGDLDVKGTKVIADTLESAFLHGSEQGLFSAQKIIAEGLSGTQEQAKKFTEILSEMDFGKLDVGSFRKEMSEAGVAISASTSDLQNFITVMADMGRTAADSSKLLQNDYARNTEIVGKVSNGGTISEDDFKKLDSEYQNYFTMMLDGTYKLTSSAEDLKEALQGDYIQKFRDQIANIASENTQLESLKGYDIGKLSTPQQSFDRSAIEEQIQLVENLGDKSDETAKKIAKWREEFDSNSIQKSTLDDIAASVSNLSEQYTHLDDKIRENNEVAYSLDLAIAESYTNVKDLKEAYQEGIISSAQAYTKAAIELDAAADLKNLDPEKLKNFSNHLQDAAESSEDLSDELKDNGVAAKVVAKSIMKMNDGVETLSKNWENWSDILRQSSDFSEEYAETMEDTKAAVADLLDVSSDFISGDFITSHLDEIAEAANGDAEAIDNLKSQLAEDIVMNIIIDNNLEANSADLMASLAELQESIPDLEIGATLDDGEFLTKAQKLIEDCGMTVEQANAVFDALGFETNFETQPQLQKQRVPEYVTETVNDGTRTETFPDGTQYTWIKTRTHTYQDGYYEAEGYIDAPAMATNGKSPKINSITKKAGGAQNNHSSSNKGGGGGKKGRGGGGGKGKKGGGGKQEKPKEDKPSDKQKDHVEMGKSDVDIYHDINIELDDLDERYKKIERSLKRISSQEKYLSGQALINNLNAQNRALDKASRHLHEEISKLKEKQALEKQDLANRQSILRNLGIQIDANGAIINYNGIILQQQEMLNKLKAEENALIDEWNAATTGTEQEGIQKKIDLKEKEIQKAEKQFENTKKQMTEYESLREQMEDTINKIEDKIDEAREEAEKKIENQIKAFSVKIQIELDLSSAERDWNKFREKVIDRVAKNNFLGLAKSTVRNFDSYYNAAGTGEVQALTKHVNDTRKELEKMTRGGHSSIYSSKNKETGKWIDDYASAQKDLKEYTDKLMESLQNVEEIAEDVHEHVMDQIEKENDAFDKQQQKYEFIAELIDHDQKLIELAYGEDQYDKLSQFYEKRAQNTNEDLDFLKRQKEEWQRQADEARAQRDAQIKGSKEWEKYNEEYEKFYNNFVNTTKQLNSTIESAIENAFNKWQNAVNKIIKKTKDAAFGDNKYESSKDTWEKTKWHDERYLDRLDRAKALLGIENNINKVINGSSNLDLQRKLAAFRDKEIQDLSKKNHLTQADVDYANKKLELIQKQMALEEVQNAKTQMRLRRDTQGNYSYEYVADEDEIKSKLEEYQQAFADLRNIPKEELKSTYDEIYSKIDEFYEKLGELAEKHKGDQEGYAKAAKELYEKYYGKDGYISSLIADANSYQQQYNEATYLQLKQLQETEKERFSQFLGLDEGNSDDKSILGALKSLLGEDGRATDLLEAFTNNIADKKWNQLKEIERNVLSKGDDSVESIWNMTLRNMAEKYDQDFLPKVKEGMDHILEQNQIWHKDLEDIERAAGMTFSNVAQGIDKNIQSTQQLLENNKKLIETYGAETDAVQRVERALDALICSYGNTRNAAIEAATKAQQAWRASLSAFEAYNRAISGGSDEEEEKPQPKPQQQTPSREPSTPATIKQGGPPGSSGNGGVNEEAALGIAKNIWTFGSWGNDPVRRKRITEKYGAETAARAQQIINEKHKNRTIGQLVDYNSKKWAYASGGYTGEWGPQGRISVLHEKEYVLNAQDTPNVLNAVGIANKVMDKVAAMNSSALEALLGNGINGTYNSDDSLNQKVEITANFPNANNAAEIEQALNNLVNMASQRASKNRRSM